LGNLLKKLSRFEESVKSYEKAIELKPDYVEARYNLGISLYTLMQYKKASEKFMLINHKSSQSYLLKCWYELNDQSNFINQLEKMLDQGQNNSVIGSLISRSKIRYGVHKQNPFCNEPLNYVLKTDLTKQCDFDNIFIQAAKNILNDDATFSRTQSLLINGTQTSGNLFSQKNDLIEKMKNIIHLEIEKYFAHFKDSEEGFIKNWSKSYILNGWLVNMKNGGKLTPHMHDHGWLSGSIYINVPPKKIVDSGNLVVCIDDKEDETDPNKNPKKSIDVVTGSICLFPSSLLHYTIPFEADEERIVLAFDVIPK
jgi:tetratricopeptide (TPR) repeat protein